MKHSGIKLTYFEEKLIESSLIILQDAYKLREIFFFGRIETDNSPNEFYYISFGYQNDIIKDRKLFYSLNGYEWLLMPDVNPTLLTVALHVQKPFTGDILKLEDVCMVVKFIFCTLKN